MKNITNITVEKPNKMNNTAGNKGFHIPVKRIIRLEDQVMTSLSARSKLANESARTSGKKPESAKGYKVMIPARKKVNLNKTSSTWIDQKENDNISDLD